MNARATASLLLHRRDDFVAGVLGLRDTRIGLASVALTATFSSAIYGWVLGSWRSPLLALYVCVKLPLLLLVTTALTAALNWIIAISCGLHLQFKQTVVISLAAIAVSGLVLASLSPIAWLFTTSLPPATTNARTTHNILYLTHTIVIASAGLAGSSALRRLLDAASRDRTVARNVYVAWVAAFAIVAGEVAWILRPFVGSIYQPVEFLRENAFDGNVYEFILTDIAPHLLR